MFIFGVLIVFQLISPVYPFTLQTTGDSFDRISLDTDLIQERVYKVLGVSFKDEEIHSIDLGLERVESIYIGRHGIPSSHYPMENRVMVDAIMLSNPVTDFLGILMPPGVKILKVLVKEKQPESKYTENINVNNDAQELDNMHSLEELEESGIPADRFEETEEKVVAIDKKDSEEVINPDAVNKAFQTIFPVVKAVLIVLPIHKQQHPVASRVVAALSRPDIHHMRISGDSTCSLAEVAEYVSSIKSTIDELKIDTEDGLISFYSIFTLAITSTQYSLAGIQLLVIDNTFFRRIVIDLNLFSEALERIEFEANPVLKTVIFYTSERFNKKNPPPIDINSDHTINIIYIERPTCSEPELQ
ncbi:hypothetical protein NEOKW01_0832 [Nematocida sp. AWRm80]|nr:hypothetical protein NEOKW01_0832 [Nematocida sp. AWRm80]